MADEQIPSQSPDSEGTVAGDQPSVQESPNPTIPPRRRVYESTLLPERKHRRVSPWVAIPLLLVILGATYYLFTNKQQTHRIVNTAGKLVYSSDQGSPGVFHIWSMNADGTGTRQMTSGKASDTSPTFTPNGSQIAFLSNRTGNVDQVYLADADGQNLIPETRNTGAKAMPKFAPSDGSLLAYTTSGILAINSLTSGDTSLILPTSALHLHAQATDGADDASIATGSATPAVVASYAWSPANDVATQSLAAVEDNKEEQTLAILPVLGKSPIESANGRVLAAADTMSIAWSPDSSTLAVAMENIRGLPVGAASGILLFNAQGKPLQTHPVILLKGAATGPQHPVYSPDGTHLLFELVSQPDLVHRRLLGLFQSPLDGSTPPQPVFRGPAENATFTADGKHIVFLVLRDDGKHDLYVVGADGTGVQRLTDGEADVSAVAVSPQAPKS